METNVPHVTKTRTQRTQKRKTDDHIRDSSPKRKRSNHKGAAETFRCSKTCTQRTLLSSPLLSRLTSLDNSLHCRPLPLVCSRVSVFCLCFQCPFRCLLRCLIFLPLVTFMSLFTFTFTCFFTFDFHVRFALSCCRFAFMVILFLRSVFLFLIQSDADPVIKCIFFVDS